MALANLFILASPLTSYCERLPVVFLLLLETIEKGVSTFELLVTDALARPCFASVLIAPVAFLLLASISHVALHAPFRRRERSGREIPRGRWDRYLQ